MNIMVIIVMQPRFLFWFLKFVYNLYNKNAHKQTIFDETLEIGLNV